MQKINSITFVLLAAVSIAFSGCGNQDYKLAPVSGTITYDGNPVDQIEVSFMPQAVGENHDVGPFSRGDTDAQGKFTLKTRYDETGAVVGSHKLIFKYVGIESLTNLSADLDDARDSGSKELFMAAKKKIADVKAQLAQRPVTINVLASYVAIVDVPASGLADLKLEITDLESTSPAP